jgi:Tfp pilus assembly protein FimT
MKENRAMSKKNSSGLTIMELILTMAILVILIAIASPLIAQFSSGYRLRGATREVATDLQFARLLAVKENKDFQVVFNSSSYQVVRASDGFVAKSRSFSIDYPEITLSTLAVTFNSRGNSSSSTISVSNPTGTKNISVGSTGRVKLG